MRKHISKALTRRSAAIRTALERYNKLAPRQNPPCQKLDYTQVISYTTLGDFTLLKHSRADIISKPWANSSNREMAMKYFKVVRSGEEIARLNIEVHRLQAWVDFDDNMIRSAINELRHDDGSAHLAAEMAELYAERHQVNNIHRARIAKICMLDGYLGVHHAGGNFTEPVVETQDEDEDQPNDEVLCLTECLDQLS